jgi:hypothetical protein
MRMTSFGELKVTEQFVTCRIRNHPYDIVVWRKLNDEYKYLGDDAVFDNNAESLYCHSAFPPHEVVWSLNAEEAVEQTAIYRQWCTRYVSKKESDGLPQLFAS